jgi:hypothetical protein
MRPQSCRSCSHADHAFTFLNSHTALRELTLHQAHELRHKDSVCLFSVHVHIFCVCLSVAFFSHHHPAHAVKNMRHVPHADLAPVRML